MKDKQIFLKLAPKTDIIILKIFQFFQGQIILTKSRPTTLTQWRLLGLNRRIISPAESFFLSIMRIGMVNISPRLPIGL